MRLYRLYDPDPQAGGGCHPVKADECRAYNERGWGIFRTVNRFQGPRRIANLVRVESWAIDLDRGTKDEQLDRIESSPLVPSTVVETKGGYHVHWRAKDATLETHRPIMDALVAHFGADKNARDVARILRVPGFDHCKDPDNRFAVTRVYRCNVSYTTEQVVDAFDVALEPEKQEGPQAPTPIHRGEPLPSGDFWERAGTLHCREALEALSGHWSVGGEHFSFKPTRTGNANILVDGKGTSCFVDPHGRIGSADKGGPTIAQWLKWYGHDYKAVRRILLDVFPDLDERSAA